MSRPARALLDATALRHNLDRVRRHAPQAKVMAVVKANGYGHGLAWAALTLAAADPFGGASAAGGAGPRSSGERPGPGRAPSASCRISPAPTTAPIPRPNPRSSAS